ncbi:lipase 3 [Nomia melanderi]|uniref:lipase 3 n=1 Tax=Nomia melanderi TaxID=2448451 RepID=UPI00130413B1|nr:lipase 3-like [Nomia melanderi]XP_031838474.1 lipase 3-like [Nomia melanderi]XP_031838475.1 lipase 3-like [Nomia melanderi]
MFKMTGLIVVLLCSCIVSTIAEELNTTSSDFDNMIPSSSRSNDNLNTLEMITEEGYPAEAHTVETEDGYLLTMHRIRGNPGSPAIFLQHGVLGSSADWVILGKGKALAYLLADQGYDVWLGNFRGNTYSRAHISLTTLDPKFWDFSWHESGIYDLPAMIKHVAQYKQQNLRAYIGFSMGTTCFYVMATERPEVTKYLQSVYNLAPVVYMKHVESPLKYFAPIATNFKTIFSLLGETEFLPQSKVIKFLAKTMCDVFSWQNKICANMMFIIAGFDADQFDYSLLPTILNHTPAGTSTKTMIHYAQEIKSGYFRQFDYGPLRNVLYYKSTSPPNYDLSKITVPIVMFCGSNDWLSAPEDVARLVHELPQQAMVYKVPYKKFNHIDFLWANNAPQLVYKKILVLLSRGV